jgi:hypothetical protein
MGFALPADVADLSTELRNAEAQAPKHIKHLLIQAADELHDLKQLMVDGAQQLELAISLRVGQMDSQSRADEVARQVRMTLEQLAARMRELA